MKHRSLLIFLAAIALAACEKPPLAEVDAAGEAYQDTAMNPDVTTYAPDSLREAQEKLAALRAEMEAQGKKGSLSRRYAAALTLASEAKSAAEKALTDAIKYKEQAKADAAALLGGFEEAISAFEKKVWAAKRLRGIKLDADIADMARQSRTAVADAEKDLAAGLYAAAKAKALTIRERLSNAEARVSEAVRLARGL